MIVMITVDWMKNRMKTAKNVFENTGWGCHIEQIFYKFSLLYIFYLKDVTLNKSFRNFHYYMYIFSI